MNELLEYAGSIALLFILVGCSPTQKIADEAGCIFDEAAGVKDDMRQATAAFEEGKTPVPFHKSATKRAENIQSGVRTIQKQMPKVEDRDTWMDRLIAALPWLAGAAIVIVGGIYFGPAIKGCANRLGWWISPETKASAELDVKVLAQKVQPSEAVAARRASDQEYNAAYKAAKKKVKEP